MIRRITIAVAAGGLFLWMAGFHIAWRPTPDQIYGCTIAQQGTKRRLPMTRFYMDHGVIHDRVTGKHVLTDGEWPFEDTVEMVCDLLNSLGKIEQLPASATSQGYADALPPGSKIESACERAEAFHGTCPNNAPPEWLWWGEVDSKDVVTFGRWSKNGARWRYKLAEIQAIEHDHPVPS